MGTFADLAGLCASLQPLRSPQRARPQALGNAGRGCLAHAALQDAFRSLEPTPLHVICACEPPGGGRLQLLVNSVGPALTVPEPAHAIVVIALLQNLRPSYDYLSDLLSMGPPRKPLIVLLVDGALEGPLDPEEVYRAHQLFGKLGVREVSVKRTSGYELRVDMSMAVRRIVDINNSMKSKLQSMVVEHDNKKFWPFVHRFFVGFPRLRRDLTPSPCVGSEIGDFLLDSVIEQAGSLKIYQCTNQTNGKQEVMQVTAKDCVSDLSDVGYIWNESHYLSTLSHPHVAELRGVFHGPSHIFLAVEYCGEHNLRWHIQEAQGNRLPVDAARDFLAQIAAALAYCHAQGVSHGDVQPRSVQISMLTEGMVPRRPAHLKLVYFACAARADRPRERFCGSMPYVAPEAVLATSFWPTPADAWSLGVTLLETLCGVGALPRLMGWKDFPASRGSCGASAHAAGAGAGLGARAPTLPAPARAHQKHAEELLEFFRDPKNLAAGLPDALGQKLPEDLLSLLRGLLAPDPKARWSLTDVVTSRWIATPSS